MKTSVVGMAFVVLVLSSCGSPPSYQEPLAESSMPYQLTGPYLLRPGDKIYVDFFFEPELDLEAKIRPDGMVSFPLIGDVQAAGRTPSELDEELTEAFGQYLKQPEIAVMVVSWAPLEVYVGGEVLTPGRVELSAGMRASQAIISRGGFNQFAAKDDVVILRRVADGTVMGRRMDLGDLDSDSPPEDDLLLEPNDVIMVPATSVAKAGRFIDAHITKVFRPVSSTVTDIYSTLWFQKRLED